MQADHHFYEPSKGHGLPHDPFNAIVGPRPIGWISSRDGHGRFNLAPYSFFNAFAYKPPIIGFSSTGSKDTLRNARDTGEFVWNLATMALAGQMNVTSGTVAREVSEFEVAQLTPVPCRLVAAPRVAESPVAFECRVTQIVQMTDHLQAPMPNWVVFGEVVECDDGNLYIAARMTQSGEVVAPLARRDQLLDASGNNGSFNSLTTDKLVIRLDPYHNHLDNAWFEVNPAGARGDQFNGDPSWDPVWEAATTVDEQGWTAEIRIPFSQLRFSTDSLQSWGLQIWRYVDATNEQSMWSFRATDQAGGAAYYGHLEGLRIPEQPRQLELLPYVVAGSRFERAAAGDPYGRDGEATVNVGADLKVLLTTNLTLDATFNPDFGQVEVDPASLNLSAFETFYDEKRPFFVAGRSAFSFGGLSCMFCSNASGLGAFYSRRIGRPPQLQGVVSGGAAYADATDNAAWKTERPGQITIARDEMRPRSPAALPVAIRWA